MRIVDYIYQITYVFLNPEKHVHSPNTKDYFNYTVVDPKTIVIKYKLILYDDYSDEVGMLKMDAKISAPDKLDMKDLNKHFNKIAVYARERFITEAKRKHLTFYISNAETIYIEGKLDAA